MATAATTSSPGPGGPGAAPSSSTDADADADAMALVVDKLLALRKAFAAAGAAVEATAAVEEEETGLSADRFDEERDDFLEKDEAVAVLRERVDELDKASLRGLAVDCWDRECGDLAPVVAELMLDAPNLVSVSFNDEDGVVGEFHTDVTGDRNAPIVTAIISSSLATRLHSLDLLAVSFADLTKLEVCTALRDVELRPCAGGREPLENALARFVTGCVSLQTLTVHPAFDPEGEHDDDDDDSSAKLALALAHAPRLRTLELVFFSAQFGRGLESALMMQDSVAPALASPHCNIRALHVQLRNAWAWRDHGAQLACIIRSFKSGVNTLATASFVGWRGEYNSGADEAAAVTAELVRAARAGVPFDDVEGSWFSRTQLTAEQQQSVYRAVAEFRAGQRLALLALCGSSVATVAATAAAAAKPSSARTTAAAARFVKADGDTSVMRRVLGFLVFA